MTKRNRFFFSFLLLALTAALLLGCGQQAGEKPQAQTLTAQATEGGYLYDMDACSEDPQEANIMADPVSCAVCGDYDCNGGISCGDVPCQIPCDVPVTPTASQVAPATTSASMCGDNDCSGIYRGGHSARCDVDGLGHGHHRH